MFSARLARSSATPLRSATRSTNPTGAFRRSYASSTPHETHPHTGTSHKQKSDLPWVVGSLAVFGPLLFYVSQPNIGGGQHVEHAKEAVAHKVADLSDKVPDSVTDAAKGAYDKAASAVGAKSSKAEEVKDQAADKAEDVKDAAKDKAGEAKDKAEEKAGTTAGDLKQKASDAIDAAKAKAGDAAHSVRSIAGTKPDDGPVVPKGENKVRTTENIGASESNSDKAQSPKNTQTGKGSAQEAQRHNQDMPKEDKADMQKATHQNGGGDGKSQNEPGKTFDDPK